MIIFGLVPYSKTSTSTVPWHIVIFGKWFNTHGMFPWRWETCLNYLKLEEVFHFYCYWLKPNTYDNMDPHRFIKVWYPFWNKN